MSRLLIEGRTRFPLVVTFPDLLAKVIAPQPPPGTLLAPAVSSAGNGIIYNPDSVDHFFRFFLRGPGGGNTQITAPGLAVDPGVIKIGAGLFNQLPPVIPSLINDQLQVEAEMIEPVVTPGMNPVYFCTYEELLVQLLTVSGRRFGVQKDVDVNPATPSVLSVPSDARSRTVLGLGPDDFIPKGLLATSYFSNRDNDAPAADKTLVLTRTDPVLPSQVILSDVVAEGARVPIQCFDLLPGQTLVASVVEATVNNDPLMYWVFVDNI
jgi:hypothetical protein